MPRAYSADMRARVIARVESGASRREAAEHYEVSASTAVIWVKCFRESGRCAAKRRGGSVSPLEEHGEFLLALIDEQTDLTLDERFSGSGLERIEGSSSGFAHVCLELGEGVFDRVEVGTVGRQVEKFGVLSLDRIPDAGDLVGGQVVHDDDIAWLQSRRQHLLDPSEKAFSVHRSVEQHWRDEACQRQTTDEGNGLPVTVRDCGAATFAFRRPAAKPRHLCRKPAFIDEDQAFRGKIALTASPALPRRPHIGAFLLAGMWGLFLCVRP